MAPAFSADRQFLAALGHVPWNLQGVHVWDLATGERAPAPARQARPLRRAARGGAEEAARSGIQNVVVPSQVAGGEPARLSVRGDRNGPLAAEHLDGKHGLLLEPNPITIGVNQNAISVLLPFVPDRGVLRLRARAAALVEHDDSSPVLRLSLGGPLGPGNVGGRQGARVAARAGPGEPPRRPAHRSPYKITPESSFGSSAAKVRALFCSPRLQRQPAAGFSP